jgi:rhodanese-related sulfurtransferase
VNSSVARQALILIALAFLPGIGEAVYFRDKVSWQSPLAPSESATVAQARAWGGNVLWVDARPDAEFEADHVPGAIPLNEDRWNELLPQFLSAWAQAPGRKVVVYCSSQSCNLAKDVAIRLRKQTDPPMQNVFVLEGGWEEWLKDKR